MSFPRRLPPQARRDSDGLLTFGGLVNYNPPPHLGDRSLPPREETLDERYKRRKDERAENFRLTGSTSSWGCEHQGQVWGSGQSQITNSAAHQCILWRNTVYENSNIFWNNSRVIQRSPFITGPNLNLP